MISEGLNRGVALPVDMLRLPTTWTAIESLQPWTGRMPWARLANYSPDSVDCPVEMSARRRDDASNP